MPDKSKCLQIRKNYECNTADAVQSIKSEGAHGEIVKLCSEPKKRNYE